MMIPILRRLIAEARGRHRVFFPEALQAALKVRPWSVALFSIVGPLESDETMFLP